MGTSVRKAEFLQTASKDKPASSAYNLIDGANEKSGTSRYSFGKNERFAFRVTNAPGPG